MLPWLLRVPSPTFVQTHTCVFSDWFFLCNCFVVRLEMELLYKHFMVERRDSGGAGAELSQSADGPLILTVDPAFRFWVQT